MKTDSNPTIKDVAQECGLSLATVSKVINGLPVSKENRQKVEAAIEKLGYRVNPYARALKSRKTNTIALVMPSLKHPFFAHMTDELTKSLMNKGYYANLLITDYDSEAEQKSIALVQANKIDGVIALTYSPDITVDLSVPVVTIDRRLGENGRCISSDNYRGGEMAAEKLIELGCHRLLFMRISSDIPGEPDKRRAGFESRCELHGVEFKSLFIHDNESEEPFFRFLEEHICGESVEYDGIFCNSDALAYRVTAFLREHGVDVPGQVQIIGFDGIKGHYVQDYVCSTIAQPIRQIAETAVNLLLYPGENVNGVNICLPVKYIPGGTTKDS